MKKIHGHDQFFRVGKIDGALDSKSKSQKHQMKATCNFFTPPPPHLPIFQNNYIKVVVVVVVCGGVTNRRLNLIIFCLNLEDY